MVCYPLHVLVAFHILFEHDSIDSIWLRGRRCVLQSDVEAWHLQDRALLSVWSTLQRPLAGLFVLRHFRSSLHFISTYFDLFSRKFPGKSSTKKWKIVSRDVSDMSILEGRMSRAVAPGTGTSPHCSMLGPFGQSPGNETTGTGKDSEGLRLFKIETADTTNSSWSCQRPWCADQSQNES